MAQDQTSNVKQVDEVYCSSCGAIIKQQAEICPHCGVRQKPAPASYHPKPKNRKTAAILAFLLGGTGAHRFYIGDIGMGFLYLCFIWTFIPMILGLVEFVLYLSATDEEFETKQGHMLF